MKIIGTMKPRIKKGKRERNKKKTSLKKEFEQIMLKKFQGHGVVFMADIIQFKCEVFCHLSSAIDPRRPIEDSRRYGCM